MKPHVKAGAILIALGFGLAVTAAVIGFSGGWIVALVGAFMAACGFWKVTEH